MNLLIKMSSNLVLLLFISLACARNVWHRDRPPGSEMFQNNGDFINVRPTVDLPHSIRRMGKQQLPLNTKSFLGAPKTCGDDAQVDSNGNCQEIIDF